MNYVLQSNTEKSLVAHHNQLRPCSTPIDQGLPVQPFAETPDIAFAEPEMVDEQGVQRGLRGTARPTYLRQVINPPLRFGDFVTH